MIQDLIIYKLNTMVEDMWSSNWIWKPRIHHLIKCLRDETSNSCSFLKFSKRNAAGCSLFQTPSHSREQVPYTGWLSIIHLKWKQTLCLKNKHQIDAIGAWICIAFGSLVIGAVIPCLFIALFFSVRNIGNVPASQEASLQSPLLLPSAGVQFQDQSSEIAFGSTPVSTGYLLTCY